MISALELFSIGIGPSSSHTVGPMRAARRFALELAESGDLARTRRVVIDLHGSLALTGHGHGSDGAVILGLQGANPETIDPDLARGLVDRVRQSRCILLAGTHEISFIAERDIHFRRGTRPRHPNTLDIHAVDGRGVRLHTRTYRSIGGGFIEQVGAVCAALPVPVPFPFSTGAELLRYADEENAAISDIVLRNEVAVHEEQMVRRRLSEVWAAMRACVDRGLRSEGTLPGGLGVTRRAAALSRALRGGPEGPFDHIEWVNAWAMAVNEENAAGGRVVTAPTNGAAGIIPAVLHFYVRQHPEAGEDEVARFLLTAAAIGILFKSAASISGADVGCQGEVGAACAMAAAGLAERLGGRPSQVEHAAEIALEHNLGLTCDPVHGLVQVPCIERNGIGAVKAINAAHMALRGGGEHVVSLDQALSAMREIGRDMSDKYKETSLGGLAVTVVAC